MLMAFRYKLVHHPEAAADFAWPLLKERRLAIADHHPPRERLIILPKTSLTYESFLFAAAQFGF